MFINVLCKLDKLDLCLALLLKNYFLEIFLHFYLFNLSFIRYINEDTTIVPLIKMIRDSGRSTFLVTNR